MVSCLMSTARMSSRTSRLYFFLSGLSAVSKGGILYATVHSEKKRREPVDPLGSCSAQLIPQTHPGASGVIIWRSSNFTHPVQRKHRMTSPEAEKIHKESVIV